MRKARSTARARGRRRRVTTVRPRAQTPRAGAPRGPGRARSRCEHLVADDPVVAQGDDRVALGVEDGVPDLEVVEQLLLGSRRAVPRCRPDVAGLVLVLGAAGRPAPCGRGTRSRGRRAAAAPPRPRPAGRGPPRVSGPSVADDPEPPDEPGQGQALPDQRREDHAEGQEDDAGRARGSLERQGQRGGQRDGAAHAGPRHDEHGSRRRYGSRSRISALSSRGR